MRRKGNATGFSLVELLLVLAVIGILSGIAIPTFLGQRHRSRLIGDAQSNAQVLRMQLETYKADNGIYGTGGPFSWTASGGVTTGASVYNFIPKGNSKMNFNLTLVSSLTYNLSVIDPSISNTYVIYTTNQNGSGVITQY